ncbi:MAG TPA: DNA-processing protein DprA [Chthoniobacterales bacterium]|nr:DNA-processing protein DprA [Chthoniobacterales bacterium]
MTETEAHIALNMVPRLGPVRLRRLLDAFGTPQRILTASATELERVNGIGPEAARSISGWEKSVDLTGELERIADFGARVLIPSDDEYPESLRTIHDPPIVLYVWGELTDRDRHAIGVVGTRKPSHYASECAKKLSYQLAYSGLTIYSGLARGIDTAAHHGALAAKGRTIAVMGSGLNHVYPPQNRELAEKIAAGNGAVITEFPMEVTPDKQTFPMRNRIVAGSSFGLLVVEAGLNSGALITANQAADQGRAIYAIPGRIDNPVALGSNKLIQQGAKLVQSAQDILDDMGLLFPEQPELMMAPAPVDLSDHERTILTTLDRDETHIDAIATRSRLPIPIVASTLLALEMRRLVKQLPGSHFVRTN